MVGIIIPTLGSPRGRCQEYQASFLLAPVNAGSAGGAGSASALPQSFVADWILLFSLTERPPTSSSRPSTMSTDDLSRSSTEQKGLLHDDIEAEGHQSSFANGSTNSQSRLKKALRQHPPWLRPRCIWIGLAVAVVLILGSIMWLQKSNIIEQILPKPPSPSMAAGISKSESSLRPTSTPLPPTVSLPNAGKFEKPKDFKVIGLVFFGRPRFVAILDCYLKRNLVVNGGFLDEVQFAVHTDKKEDIAWLDNLVKTSELYKKVTIPEGGYNIIWQHTVESGPMYIKIDDDMVSTAPLSAIHS